MSVMACLFFSGSVIPASAERNSFFASTKSTCMPKEAKSLTMCWGSSFLIRSLSMKTVFNWSPMARCPRTVTAELSTPPLSALIAFSVPMVCLM